MMKPTRSEPDFIRNRPDPTRSNQGSTRTEQGSARYREFQSWMFILWALSVNFINGWLVKPLVQHFQVFGVLLIMAVIAIWLVSIPPTQRKQWVSFTLYTLLLFQALTTVHSPVLAVTILLNVLSILGLALLLWLFSRVSAAVFVVATVLVGVWAYLPWEAIKGAPKATGSPSGQIAAAVLLVLWLVLSWLLQGRRRDKWNTNGGGVV